MIFNPITNKLYDNDGNLLKKLFCPFNIQWNDLKTLKNSEDRLCTICNTDIIDTKNMTDLQIQLLVKNNPDICLKINFDQENIRISTHV